MARKIEGGPYKVNFIEDEGFKLRDLDLLDFTISFSPFQTWKRFFVL